MTQFLEELESIHKQCFGEHHWTANDFLELQQSGAEIYGSSGAIIAWRQILDEVELLTICVLPEYRRTGLGESMISMMEKQVREKGAKKIFLEVSDINSGAIDLYIKSGFLPISRRNKYYADGSDALIFSKTLD